MKLRIFSEWSLMHSPHSHFRLCCTSTFSQPQPLLATLFDYTYTINSKYGQGRALGLATYLRIGSNLEIWQVRKIGGRPQYFRMTHYTEILNLFWQHLDYQWCTMLFSNRMVLYIIWNLAGWYSKLVNMNKRYIREHDFQNDLKYVEIRKKCFLLLIMEE